MSGGHGSPPYRERGKDKGQASLRPHSMITRKEKAIGKKVICHCGIPLVFGGRRALSARRINLLPIV
jgi:hypothetical protein